ncbi:TetR/AcrR family transcriptional regulator [Nocardia sp. NPDC055165]
MTKRNVAKRPRRERGSLNPQDIIEGAFELAEQVSIDGLSMPMLGRHLDVGVTSIYWYFRKKDDLLNAMTDWALSKYAFATPFVESSDWRQSLTEHAHSMRSVFLGNPILCDLILIRSALSPLAAQFGARQMEHAIASLVEAGLSVEDAFDTYSALNLHVRGSVVLQRLYDKNKNQDAEAGAYYDEIRIEPATTPLLAEAMAKGRKTGAPDDHNFDIGLDCILDRASELIEISGGDMRRAGPWRRDERANRPEPRLRHALDGSTRSHRAIERVAG